MMAALLEELYNQDFSDFQNYSKSNLNQMKNNTIYTDEYELDDYYNPQQIKEPFGNFKNICNEFQEHLKTCSECRNKMIVYKEEKFFTDEVLDLILYIISGIFILYLINLFFNLGKSFK